MPSRTTTSGWLLFFFATSFTFFAIQSSDVLMYLSLVRDFFAQGHWPPTASYLYSRPDAEFHIAHEYLSYFLFYGAYQFLGLGGLIALKVLVLTLQFAIVLRAGPRARNASALWMGLWLLAVLAASFRFIERSSLFSDLFCVLLLSWLLNEREITRPLIIKLSLLFAVWVQVHPGFPLGILMMLIWASWNWRAHHAFRNRQVFWLLLPMLFLICNPEGMAGALYPFRFAMNEARVLRLHNLEWFPTFHPAFRFTPEVIGFWALLTATAFLLWREKAWLSLNGVFAIFLSVCGVYAVRFVPWTSFALLITIKPWAEFKTRWRFLEPALAILMLAMGCKNLMTGYTASSGKRVPEVALDKNLFPIGSLDFLRSHPLTGRVYNSQDFGSYMIWQGFKPVFDHGFVTDMDFYESEVVGIFHSQANFLRLVEKYHWTMLLVDKHGSYPYFFKILSPLKEWKIVAEDEASYLIYYLP